MTHFVFFEQPKSTKCREDLKKGMEEGISIRGIGHQVLSKELYQETIILSDMYDLNEFVALDLLCTAQIQMSFYPGLPRGLVAVLLYYDARKSLVAALRMLIQARTGVAWCLKVPDKVEKFITQFTDQLMENGLFTRIFELLKTLDFSKEMEKLQQNVALGGPKHRRQISFLFKSIRFILSDIVFMWSVHCGLPKSVTLDLIRHLSSVKLEEEASGKIDDVTLNLQLALLSATDLSILHTREDGEDVVQNLPILAEEDFINALLQELLPNTNKPKWACEGLQAVTLFGFSICLSSLRLVPQNQQLQRAIEQEDIFADAAISMKVFEFFDKVLLESDLIRREELILRRLHNLFTDFIVLMYSKVKELRIKADETARTIQAYAHEGLEAPATLPRHFEQLLLALAHLYQKNDLNLNLTLDYWASMDNSLALPSNYSFRAPARSISLFKFVRLAGEMLPATLFVPYLRFLSSLCSSQQAARFCFNLLKQSGPGNAGSPVTWDHFFASFAQYYHNLRQEVTVATDMIYRHRSAFHKGITPHEIDGLQAVLLLIKTVAEQDEFSRVALCEHPGWVPLTILLGLVSCPIPIPLKADLLSTLAMLAKSPETAAQMWNNLESSQILVTIPSTSNYQPRGIQTELDEIESRMEEYPLTRALLELLDVLTDSGIPRTLGAGPRKPGFDPYLTFVINSVFLKFNVRAYKNPVERWEIAEKCLKLFGKFVSEYDPSSGDFPSSGSKPNEFNSPPGFHVVVQMHTKSDFLNLLLLIIDEGSKLYNSYVPFPGESYVEKCTLHCLNIIDKCLNLQTKFFSLLTASSMPILLTHLSKLLLTINPRSGKPDHVLNIAKYVSSQFLTTSHSLVALKILIYLTSSPAIHNQIVNILLSSDGMDREIFAGFVECLDETIEEERAEITIAAKESVLKLLKQCLDYNAPNLSHFFFGFDLRKDVSHTVFQLPGVMDFPRSCIHSLLGLLRLRNNTHAKKPSLLETAYQLLYELCANNATSGPVLRLLRLQPSFFKEHLSWCVANFSKGPSELNQLSWMLKIIAIELRVSCKLGQVYHLKQLSTLLVGLPVAEGSQSDEFAIMRDVRTATSFDSESKLNVSMENLKDNLLVNLITQFDFKVKSVTTPHWEFFDNAVLDNLLRSCQSEAPGAIRLIDVKKLHQILLEELSGLQGSIAMGQRQSILQEIQKVLGHALEINSANKRSASVVNFASSWCQITQVLCSYLPYGILTCKEQQNLNILILENLLTKIVKEILLPDVANLLSGATLILMKNLRKSQLREDKQRSSLSAPIEDTQSVFTTSAMSLKTILNLLIEWILVADVSAQKLKINLYGSLVVFLNLVNVQEQNEDAHLEDTFYVSRLDSSRYQLQNKKFSPLYISTDVLMSYGQKLIEMLSQDSISGQEVCKMLSMANFAQLIHLTGNIAWITFMSSKGFLKHMVQSVLDSDKDLRAVLEPVPENLRALYIYEAKMSLLSRLATTKVGAELLLEQRLLSCLSTMKVFDYHPDVIRHTQFNNDSIESSFITPVEHRYLQLWLPTLNLCNGILNSLGSENQSAVTQIMYFLISHLEVVELILRAGNPSLDADSLKELSILTGILSRTANNDLIAILENYNMPQDNRAYLYRLHKLVLTLLPRFVLTENNIRELLCGTDGSVTTYQTSDRLLHTLKIITNLLMFARNAVENNGIDHSAVGIIFQPSLADSYSGFNGKGCRNINEHSPSIGTVVQQLINMVNYYHKEKITLEFLKRKMVEIPEMNTVQLKEITLSSNPANQGPQVYDLNLLKETAAEIVSSKLRKKKMEIDYCNFAIEHCMYLIWCHLDYYMLKAIPRTKNFGLMNSSAPFNLDCKYYSFYYSLNSNAKFVSPPATLVSASEAMWKVSTDDISNLKQGLISIFNDSFSRQLIETSQV